jgi:CubicO group peptidase (beta-lactamase class C family)
MNPARVHEHGSNECWKVSPGIRQKPARNERPFLNESFAAIEICEEKDMKSNLFVPFGMASSGYVWNDLFEKRMARPHDQKGKPFENHKRTAADVARFAAAGDLHTTPTDYAKFVIETLDPKESDQFHLEKASLAEMVRPQVKVAETDQYSMLWGLGWRITRTKQGDFINHGGANNGFHCYVQASVETGDGFVIMTNGENGGRLLSRLAPAVARLVHR